MELTQANRELVEGFRKQGILLDIDDHRLDQKKGVVLVTCADGDQFPDIFTQQVRMQNGHRDHPRIHAFGWNGGALRIARNSPTNVALHTTDQDLLQEIVDACAMKEIGCIALYVHTPCGKASRCNLSLTDIIGHLMNAKLRIKEAMAGICVAPFLHADYQNGRKRSYFVSREAWEKFCTISTAS